MRQSASNFVGSTFVNEAGVWGVFVMVYNTDLRREVGGPNIRRPVSAPAILCRGNVRVVYPEA